MCGIVLSVLFNETDWPTYQLLQRACLRFPRVSGARRKWALGRFEHKAVRGPNRAYALSTADTGQRATFPAAAASAAPRADFCRIALAAARTPRRRRRLLREVARPLGRHGRATLIGWIRERIARDFLCAENPRGSLGVWVLVERKTRTRPARRRGVSRWFFSARRRAVLIGARALLAVGNLPADALAQGARRAQRPPRVPGLQLEWALVGEARGLASTRCCGCREHLSSCACSFSRSEVGCPGCSRCSLSAYRPGRWMVLYTRAPTLARFLWDERRLGMLFSRTVSGCPQECRGPADGSSDRAILARRAESRRESQPPKTG